MLQINSDSYEVGERIKNKRGKTSWIWGEGYQLTKLPSNTNPKKKSEVYWLCRHCFEDSKYIKYGADSTNHAAKHLLTVHELTEHRPVEDNNLISSRFDFKHFKKLLIR
jgi:hypothetical protein